MNIRAVERTGSERDIWLPHWRTTEILTVGAEWPSYLVEKWERNGIGEERFVTSAMYSRPDAGQGVTRRPR